MRKLWQYLKSHVKEDFHAGLYLSIATLLIVSLILNYKFDFEDSYLDRLKGFKKFAAYFLFYAIPYFLSTLLYTVFKKERSFLRNRRFWFTAIFGLSILSLDSSVPFLQPLIFKNLPSQIHYWSYKVAVNIVSFFTVFIPILLFYYWFEQGDKDRYGLSAKRFDAKPYWLMLAIMLPLLFAASTTKGFQKQYPMYKTNTAHLYLEVEETVTIAAYEIAYGMDFITVEYLFRGFFILAMAAFLKRNAVLSMAVIYCLLHFGKPAGEAISSIFGGYILGVFAYETRSIWGGVMVHMGIAWMMELMAYLQKLL